MNPQEEHKAKQNKHKPQDQFFSDLSVLDMSTSMLSQSPWNIQNLITCQRKCHKSSQKTVSHIGEMGLIHKAEYFIRGRIFHSNEAWLDSWLRCSPKFQRTYNCILAIRHALKKIKMQYRPLGRWLNVKMLSERQLCLSWTCRKAILKTTSQRECTFYSCSQIATLPKWPLYGLETIWEFESKVFTE